MDVYITAIDGAPAINTMSVLDTITKADDAWRHLGDPTAADLFDVHVCGPDGGDAHFGHGVRLPATLDPTNDPTPALVVVPGLDDRVPQSLEHNRAWIPHLQRWHTDGAIVASSCTGAFLLAPCLSG